MTTFFTADTHFSHANIIKYANRPFSSVEEMDEALVERWNSVVRDDDDVYFLGDLTLSTLGTAEHFLSRLRGNIRMLEGNHDKRWFGQFDFNYFRIRKLEPVHDVNINGQHIVLCHYAMRTWNKSHYGAWHLFGHTHGTLGTFGLSFDVGVDTNNYYPYSFEQVQEQMNRLTPVINHPVR